MAARAQAFHLNIAELLGELENRQQLLTSEISQLRTRLRSLPQDNHERLFLVQEMTRAGASFAELESLCTLITGKKCE